MSIAEDSVGIHVMSSHENYFLNLLDILDEHEGEVYIFTSDNYKNKISEEIIDVEKYTWITRSESESLSSFLSRASKVWNSRVETLILFPIYGGIQNIKQYYKVEFECTYIQMIYNIHLWCFSNLRLTPRIDWYVNLLIRTQILSRADGVIVEYSPIKTHLKEISSVTNIGVFSPVIFEGTSRVVDSSKITVPGYIDRRRRDYNFLLNTLEDHLGAYQDELEIHLLGSINNPSGERVLNYCDQLVASGWDIKYHSGWIPVNRFEQILKTTNVILSPIKKNITKQAVVEQYGTSKASGTFGDAIKYGKPLFLPAHYKVPPETKPFVRTYDNSKELSNLILSSLRSDELSRKGIEEVKKRFNLEKQRQRFYDTVSQMIYD